MPLQFQGRVAIVTDAGGSLGRSLARARSGLLHLVSEEAPTKAVLCAGAGTFERAHVALTQGVHVGTEPDAPERVAQAFEAISDRRGRWCRGVGRRRAPTRS